MFESTENSIKMIVPCILFLYKKYELQVEFEIVKGVVRNFFNSFIFFYNILKLLCEILKFIRIKLTEIQRIKYLPLNKTDFISS